MEIPTLVAHRGWPARYPENSLEGIAAARDAGAACIEFDVQIAADGVPVVVHDDNLRRTAGVDRPVLETPSAQLRTATIGQRDRFGDAYATARLPTLAEAVALLRQRPPDIVFIEIKRASLRKLTLEPVVPPILEASHVLGAHAVIISFDPDAVALAKRSGFRTGWALEEWSDEKRRIADDLAPEFLFCKIARLPPAPEPLWQGPWKWVAYQTDDAEQAIALAARGIPYIETDAIGDMLNHRALSPKGGARGG